jgi:gamma-glutamyl-gamma-aminobutyraldehyde dehydrogenase/4-guanidinobutyraldehyde dehydrogenase/NAD-dependent aldehyde dehydrogenase
MTTISEGPRSVAEAVADLDIRSQAFVDGAFVDAVSGETFDCVSPITGESVGSVAACDAADVDRAVAGARAAFDSGVWSRLAPKKRKKRLQKLAALMAEHAEELALLETVDMGKPIRDATNVDVPLATECIAWYGEAIDKVYDEIAPTGPDAHVSIVREPLGVVGAVVPWNFPLMMASWKLGPALATGNSVVLKPAEQSPLTALRLAELASEAGIPDGVLQVVPGFGETAGQAIGRHPDVDMVAFTGSTVVGKLFLRYSGESNMKRVALECGG